MGTVTATPARKRAWEEIQVCIETCEEIPVDVLCYAERDASTGRWGLMRVDMLAVTLRMGGGKVTLPIDAAGALRVDQRAILNEVERDWWKIEPLLNERWEESQGWSDPE